MFWHLLATLLLAVVFPQPVAPLICSRYPSNTLAPKSPVDENFVISVSGNPQTYILGQEYNVSLSAFNGLRYVTFALALENENGDINYNDDLGHFEISDSVETRYSPNCINMVESTNANPKTRVDVIWVAPEQPGSGCVLIRATVLQHRDVWYMDDGGLTKRICEEVVDDVESQSKALTQRPCCACDEARYELTFEGTWSRNLHPKDFPTKGWKTRFSDIVGAAHTSDYRFWEYGELATEGMQELAEHGSPRSLEREFNMNFKNGNIRTIIKARGPAFPNLNGQSVASVRVGPQHHLISLASKIDPSPDWIVGISGLELCMTNCTWLEQKIINLYPWDVGTDAGASYTSPDQPQKPADVIRRMRSDFPNDPRSPFYDENGAPMKPLAALTIKRQRLYERLCEDEDSNNVGIPRECFTHPWSTWSECTASCGTGRQYRTRVYKQPDVARIYNCEVELREDQECVGETCRNNEKNYSAGRAHFESAADEEESFERPQAQCQLGRWGAWSICSKTCGKGKKMRRRQYANPMAEEKCQSVRRATLIEYADCNGPNCMGEISSNRRKYGYVEEAAENDEFDKENIYARKPASMEEQNAVETHASQENSEDWRRESENLSYGAANNDKFKPDSHENDRSSRPRPYENNRNSVRPQETGRYGQGSYEKEAYNRPAGYDNNSRYKTRPYDNEQRPVYGNNYGEENRDENAEEDNNDGEGRANTSDDNQEMNSGEESSSTDMEKCFQSLQLFPCLDETVTANYWFYNYCENRCMLYAADSCDRNENKFTSLEKCDFTCRQPEYEPILIRKQIEDCPRSIPSDRRNNRRRKNRRRPYE